MWLPRSTQALTLKIFELFQLGWVNANVYAFGRSYKSVIKVPRVI